MLLIDPPRWPAHGTVFGHLVSDVSLAELHAFARRVGLPAGAFDHDHYDVPERLYPTLRDAGAALVPTRELLTRLEASGLRVRPRDRQPGRTRATRQVLAHWDAAPPAPREVRDELLGRWQEPHRRYHDVRHLTQALSASDTLGARDPLVTLALWGHDAVYTGVAGEDEESSARLTGDLLERHLPRQDVAEVKRLIRLTAHHEAGSDDTRGARLIDADLSILAVSEPRYHVYARDVRREYAHIPEPDFVRGREAVLRGLLAHRRLYQTANAGDAWEAPARRNVSAELDHLATGLPLVPGGSRQD